MQVSYTNAFVIPLFFNLVGIFGCWVYYAVRAKSPREGIRAKIYRCEKCEHVYLDKRDASLANCPRCGTLNEAIKR